MARMEYCRDLGATFVQDPHQSSEPDGGGIPQDRFLSVGPNKLSAPHQNHPVLREVGFSPDFPARLESLSEVLISNAPPKTSGFNIKFEPGGSSPVDFRVQEDPSFTVEIAGYTERGTASLRIRPEKDEMDKRDLAFKLSDVQEFAALAFPGKKVYFRSKPRIIFQKRIFMATTGRVGMPESLYDEETSWKAEISAGKKRTLQSTGRFLDGLLPDINVELETVTDEQIAKLFEDVSAAKVDVTFYSFYDPIRKRGSVNRKERMMGLIYPQLYNDFQVTFENTEEDDNPILDFYVIVPFKDTPNCYLKELYFHGSAEEIESVIVAFTNFMKQTPRYKYKNSIDEKGNFR